MDRSNNNQRTIRSVFTSDLSAGSVYFMLNYYDEDMLVPEMKTLVFLGRNIDESCATEEDLFYFQDYGSFSEMESISHHEDICGEIICCKRAELNGIYNLENVIALLTRCLDRRARQDSP